MFGQRCECKEIEADRDYYRDRARRLEIAEEDARRERERERDRQRAESKRAAQEAMLEADDWPDAFTKNAMRFEAEAAQFSGYEAEAGLDPNFWPRQAELAHRGKAIFKEEQAKVMEEMERLAEAARLRTLERLQQEFTEKELHATELDECLRTDDYERYLYW